MASENSLPQFPDLVFLTGCARSGTSILGEVLAAHPDVHYLYEDNAPWKEAFRERKDDSLTPQDASDTKVIDALRARFREVADPGSLVLDKNPKHSLRIGFLDAVFPGCRVIHIVRDGRDVAASLMFRNRGKEWGHLRIPGWKELLARHPSDHHLRCAHQWKEAVSRARSEGTRLGERYREIRFEALVVDPGPEVERLLGFLGLGMSAEVESAAAKIQNDTSGSYHARRQVRHYVENHQRRVGRYLENLSAAELAGVTEVCGELLAELGYTGRE